MTSPSRYEIPHTTPDHYSAAGSRFSDEERKFINKYREGLKEDGQRNFDFMTHVINEWPDSMTLEISDFDEPQAVLCDYEKNDPSWHHGEDDKNFNVTYPDHDTITVLSRHGLMEFENISDEDRTNGQNNTDRAIAIKKGIIIITPGSLGNGEHVAGLSKKENGQTVKLNINLKCKKWTKIDDLSLLDRDELGKKIAACETVKLDKDPNLRAVREQQGISGDKKVFDGEPVRNVSIIRDDQNIYASYGR